MSALPEHKLSTIIDQAHEKKAESFRPHFGVSQLGHSCDRYLWLNFRWAIASSFPGRMLRLFRRGHLEEETVIADLRAIGCALNERQTKVEFGSFVSGSCDGIITGGLPGYENKKLVLEIKTHSKKSFDELVKKGVHLAKEQHYIQMQGYMLGLGIDRALYYAVCKDDDRIHTEIIRLDLELAKKYVERGKKIALSDYMPEPLSADPSWYQCKMCSFHTFCFESKLTKEVNCRTCALVTATTDSQFLCARHDNAEVPVEFQRQGCEGHVLHPDLVPYERAESTSDFEAVYIIDGQHVRNGEPDERVFSSKEIIADPGACARPDEVVDSLRQEFNAKIIENNSF